MIFGAMCFGSTPDLGSGWPSSTLGAPTRFMKQCLLTREEGGYGVILAIPDKMAKVGKLVYLTIETDRGIQKVTYTVHVIYTVKPA